MDEHDEHATGPAPSEMWRGDRAARWVAQWEALDRQLAPVTEVLLAAAAVQRGERVLDVGCGTGPTTRLAAAAAGATGEVVGVDVATEMIAAARDVAVPAAADGGDPAPIEWVVADATTWVPDGGGFDLVLSRFGVMFFDDPDAAFANLRACTRPGGRLVIATWQHRSASPMFEVPLRTLLDRCAAWGLQPEVLDPAAGPFSLDADVVRSLLERSGWHSITTTPRTLPLPVGGHLDAAGAAEVAMEVGPVRFVADQLDDARRAEARAAIADELARHVDGSGHVVLDGGIVVTTAIA